MKALLKLFLTFFKIGLFTFGGGYAMIATIKEEVVEKNKWLTEEELLEIIAIAESTPGPIAINMATFVGYKQKKIKGSIFSTLGVVLPSFIVILLISLILDQFMANIYVQYAFVGIKCAVAFLILKAGMNMLKKLPKTPLAIIMFLIIFALEIVFEIFSISFSSIYFILIGGIIGIFAYSLINRQKEESEKWLNF